MFKLLVDDASGEREVLLPEGDTVFGRAPTCDVLIADPSVSRWHARFAVTGDRCVLSDVGSRNGTFVNGERIQEAELREGDEVKLGDIRVVVTVTNAPPLVWSEGGLPDAAGTVYRPVDAPPEPGRDTAETLARLRNVLAAVAQILVRAAGDTDVLERIVQLAFDHFAAARAVLLLPQAGTGDLAPRVSRLRDEIAQSAVSRSVVARVMRDRVAVLASNAGESVLRSETLIRQGVRCFMCAPLWQENSVSGVLYIDTAPDRDFDSSDLEVLVSLANYAAIAIEQARVAALLREETQRRERLERYHSPAVVERILRDQTVSSVALQEQEASVLFADLVGFTAIAERLQPADVGRLLNEGLSLLTDVVFEENGTLDKYLGDAILAAFGVPFDQPDHALRAVRAAIEMRRRLTERNRLASIPLELRVGISSGLIVAGDLGSARRREYTVLGDVVNTAARLQQHVAAPGEIVVTAATARRLGEAWRMRSAGLVTLKGREQAVEVFAIEE